MGYNVKWVETHLGVSRKALRNFEKYGLMPKNENKQNRDYDEDDIHRIWGIRVLQGMGFSVKEIVGIRDQALADEDFSLQPLMGKKIKELEQKIEDMKLHLSYAQTIKYMGVFPSFPKEFGKETCDEFRERVMADWNLGADPEERRYLRMAELVLSENPEEMSDSDFGRLMEHVLKLITPGSDLNKAIEMELLLRNIINRVELDAKSAKVQLLVELLHDHFVQTTEDGQEITPKIFAKCYAHVLMQGDRGELMQKKYGATGCAFAADAISIYGGYASYQELCESVEG